MSTEPRGTARSMALLWATPESSAARRGQRSALDVGRIVSAAVALADAEGLSAVSMRRVAAEVGVPTMTLYGHVPGKGELVDLMLDTVLGEVYPDEQAATSGNWRTRVEAVARANWALLARHPWASSAATGRPPTGPNAMRKYETELRAVDGLGLSENQMDLLVTLVNGFVRGSVGGNRDGPDDQPWRAATGPYAALVLDPVRFPTAARVGPVAAGEPQGAAGQERSFEFGLERLLDGIGVLILNPAR